MFNKNLKLALATTAICSIAFGASQSDAASLTASGDIEIREALAISETTGINFGQVETVASGIGEITVDKTGSLSATGTNILDSTSASQGVFSITGSATETIDIDIDDGGNVSGMSFTDITGDYGSTTDGDFLTGVTAQDAPGTSGTDLTIGATLQVNDTVAEGTYTPEIVINVNYN